MLQMDNINKLAEYINKNKFNTRLILIVLIIILLWRVINQNILLVIGISFIVWSIYNKELKKNNADKKESFDQGGTEFLPLGEPRYDLKGDRVESYPVDWPEPPTYNCCGSC